MSYTRTRPAPQGIREHDARRFSESASVVEGASVTLEWFHQWFAEVGRRDRHSVKRAPLDGLAGWTTDPETGDLKHTSGRFYTVEGLEVSTRHRSVPLWRQPIIVQPEIGVLGLLVKEFDGVLHCLVQTKMEPGNINGVQLSPTVQATRSNYTRAHRGAATAYLEYFVGDERGRVLLDSLQSEQGSWFLHKRNRNMVVETREDVPLREGFCWLTLGQLHELLPLRNMLNMDIRSVLSTIPFRAPTDRPSLLNEDTYRGALLRSMLPGLPVSSADGPTLTTWFFDEKSSRTLSRTLTPLNRVDHWVRTPERISHVEERYFSVIGVDVEAEGREVRSWSQPLLAPVNRGLLALLTKRVDGVLHVLVQARSGAGSMDVVELAPSLQCTPANYADGASPDRPPFLDYVLGAPPERIRFDAVHSEEGGRFYHAENNYMVVDTGDDIPSHLPEGYTWTTVRQLADLVQHENYLNVEMRCLLACLHSLL
ncbi:MULTISPECIES: NDP-hexose 2,3-dehydratase family protein [unclassified Nocardiopsis]|uniref:NDP-hexose 2,3-dehydratase family protein n=1 Tax=Nocardiopsis TaxID=2013 RepID=UPI00387B5BBF